MGHVVMIAALALGALLFVCAVALDLDTTARERGEEPGEGSWVLAYVVAICAAPFALAWCIGEAIREQIARWRARR